MKGENANHLAVSGRLRHHFEHKNQATLYPRSRMTYDQRKFNLRLVDLIQFRYELCWLLFVCWCCYSMAFFNHNDNKRKSSPNFDHLLNKSNDWFELDKVNLHNRFSLQILNYIQIFFSKYSTLLKIFCIEVLSFFKFSFKYLYIIYFRLFH